MSETLNLQKGERVDLTKTNPGLKLANVGLGWDINAGNSGTFDLDAFAFSLKASKLKGSLAESVCYFGNKTLVGVQHGGDNLTGAGDGDDETIKIDLAAVPADVDEILIGVNIYQAASKRQNFGMVNNAFIRVYDADTKAELVKFDLTEDYSAFTGVIAGSLYRKDGEFKFKAVGSGINGDIDAIATPFK